DRHGPLLVLPVVRRLAVERKSAPTLELLREERLHERVADIRAIAGSRERFDVVDERAEGPAGLGLLEHEGARTRAPFLRAQQVVRCRGQQEDRTDTPDQAIARRFRRKEERRRRVTESGLAR